MQAYNPRKTEIALLRARRNAVAEMLAVVVELNTKEVGEDGISKTKTRSRETSRQNAQERQNSNMQCLVFQKE